MGFALLVRGLFTVPVAFFAGVSGAGAQSNPGTQPARWNAQYIQVYSDNIETIAPALGSAFSLGPAGSLTSNAAEVIAGSESIKGSYSTAGSSLPFLQTNSSVLPLSPNHSYTVAFQYKILTAPNPFFVVQFLSFVAASESKFLNGATIMGAAGATGTITLTSTLGNYSDYVVSWGCAGTGAISIDNIQVIDAATGKVIASENAEGTGPTLRSGIQPQGAAMVVTDPSLVISGKASLLLTNGGGFVTNPSAIPIGANTVYAIQFDYRVVSPTVSDQVLHVWLQPAGTTDPQLQVTIPGMLKNAAARGMFSSGAQTAGASSYALELYVQPGVSLVVDNILVYRQDVTMRNAPLPTWQRLATAPFPRLGRFYEGNTYGSAEYAPNEGVPFFYTVQQIESRLAFGDVIAGVSLQSQTQDPDSIHRIRALNPNAVILTETFLEQLQSDLGPPSAANTDLTYQLFQNTPNQWKATDTAGDVIYDRNYPGLAFMNLSDFAPVMNGQTWRTAVQNYMTNQVFPSGLWDGILLSNSYSVLDPAYPNFENPALFNYNWKLDGQRQTPAATSDMIRAAKIQMLQQLNSSTNGLQFTLGHIARPEFALAPLVNGFVIESFNLLFGQPGAPITSSSPASWRAAFEAYLQMQAAELPPQANLVAGFGESAADANTAPNASNHYLTATPDDIAKHRFTMGTVLLGNGFYDYCLKDSLGAPYWFDEYSVDSNGNSVEDLTKKGYLGQALSDATELTNAGTLVLQENFDSGTLPNSFSGNPTGVSITQTPGEVISGTGSLVISNPNHTQQGMVGAGTNPAIIPLSPGVTYLLQFDWRILETLDFDVGFQIFVSADGGQPLDLANAPGVVTGDSGTMHFPFTIPSAGNWAIYIFILNGGGKVAIDNVKLYQGGVGPWRRDFEGGFVLVNPFSQAHTFSAADLAGALHRTGIHRINGTQAPDVNNGQPVTGDLTLGPFDAIILLAGPICAPPRDGELFGGAAGAQFGEDLAGAEGSAGK